jgi:hypothetical protein
MTRTHVERPRAAEPRLGSERAHRLERYVDVRPRDQDAVFQREGNVGGRIRRDQEDRRDVLARAAGVDLRLAAERLATAQHDGRAAVVAFDRYVDAERAERAREVCDRALAHTLRAVEARLTGHERERSREHARRGARGADVDHARGHARPTVEAVD